MNLVDVVNELHVNPNVKELPDFRSGDTVAVHYRITEGGKTRVQIFQGICIGMKAKNSKGITSNFRVRKISSGVGVERVFPFHSPNIADVKIISRGKTKKAKQYFLRERSGKSAKIKVDYSKAAE